MRIKSFISNYITFHRFFSVKFSFYARFRFPLYWFTQKTSFSFTEIFLLILLKMFLERFENRLTAFHRKSFLGGGEL